MGFTTEQSSEEKQLSKMLSNSMKKTKLEIKKNDFYSFLQELNYKTEIGLE